MRVMAVSDIEKKAYERYAEELLNSYEANRINEILDEYSYMYFYALLDVIRAIGDIDNYRVFLSIKKSVNEAALNRIKKNSKVTIVFMADLGSYWIGNELFRLLYETEWIDPYVLILSEFVGQSDELRIKSYENNLEFYKQKIEISDRVLPSVKSVNEQYSWEELGIYPDVCIWLNPWSKYRGDFDLRSLSLKVLHVYIPYCLSMTDTADGDFIQYDYNMNSELVMWKIFYDYRRTVETAKKVCLIGDSAAVYTGYPKLDPFYEQYERNEGIWSRLDRSGGRVKRVIYSPHHTVDTEGDIPLKLSTFKFNGKFMLELAKKYKDDTVWIFRPHPQLKMKALRYGIFSNESEWDDYLDEWNSMENALVYENGDYYDLFMNSDLLINDCSSFIGEYMFSKKPMIFLESGENYFSAFAQEIINNQYTVSGKDFKKIEDVFRMLILDGKDPKKDKRGSYFDQNMDYRSEFGGKSASGNIYDHMISCLRPARL